MHSTRVHIVCILFDSIFYGSRVSFRAVLLGEDKVKVTRWQWPENVSRRDSILESSHSLFLFHFFPSTYTSFLFFLDNKAFVRIISSRLVKRVFSKMHRSFWNCTYDTLIIFGMYPAEFGHVIVFPGFCL